MNGFGLINMSRPKGEHEQVLRVTRGRVYDPKLGRFLSPDPVLQDASNTQNLNRYSYVLNNPLKYTDPSGYTYRSQAVTFKGRENPDGSYGNSGGFDGGGGSVFPKMGVLSGEAGPTFEDLYSYIGEEWVRKSDISSGEYFRQALNRYSNLVESANNYAKALAISNDGIQLSVSFKNGSVFTFSAENGLYSVSDLAVTIYGHSYILSTQKAVYDWAGSVDWREVGNAGLGIVLGGLEVAAGGAAEGITFGASTALLVDGWARIGSGGVKLYHLLQGNTKAGVATPSNLGGWSGKLVDMGFGASYTDIGIGQGLGGFTNDFATFVIGGGSVMSLQNMVVRPNPVNAFKYLAVPVGTSYSTVSDIQAFYNYNH